MEKFVSFLYVTEEIRIPISRIKENLDSINNQCYELAKQNLGHNFCCLISEIDLIAIKQYYKQEYEIGENKIIYHTVAGPIQFYIANVTEPIIGYN